MKKITRLAWERKLLLSKMLMTPNGGECFFGKKHFREAPTHNDDHDHDHDHDELFLCYG